MQMITERGWGTSFVSIWIQVLLSLWFKSEILDVGMWNKLAARFPKWTHRKDIIQYWSGAIAGLTQRVVRRLYGPSEGSPFLSVSVKSFTAQFDVSEKFLVYAWHRMIYIIGNVNQIEDSQNYDLAIKGVARVVDIMHAVGTKDFHEESDGDLPPAPAPIIRPDGNSILTLFGPWLFQASGRHSPEFEDGKAEAVATLCRIFSLPQRPSHSFTRTNLASFYTVLRGALHANPISLAAALHGCTTLFLQNLPGLRALVPDVIAGVRRVLPGEQKSTNGKISLESEALRRTALKVVACVLALLNHFDGVPVRDKESALLVTTPPSARVEPEESPTMMRIRVHYAHSEENLHVKPATNPLDPETTFVALKPFLLDTLIASLVVESSPTNCKQILHLLCCFAFEDVGFCPSVPSLAIGAIRDRIVAKAWPPEVVFSAMDCLSHLTLVWEYVNHSTKSCSRELVLSLCAYIDSLFQGDNIVANQNLIIEAYNCMVRWTLVGGWILDDKDCLKVVVACLSRGVALLDKDDDFGVVTPISPSSSSPQHPAIGLTNTLAPKSSSDKASSDKGGLTLPATDRPSTASIGSTTASAIANHFANMVAGSSERSGTSAGAGGGSSLSGSSGSSSSSARKGRHPRLFLRARGSIVVGASASSAGSALLNAAANAGLLSPVLLNLPGPGSSSASSTMTIHNDAAKTSGGPSMMNSTNATAVSTGTRDGGLGLPTFAVLTSQVTIKAAAEIGLSQISNYLGNFPPAAAGAGVSRLSTLWDEVSEAKRILEKRQNMLKENSSQSSDIGKYLRYFAYDGRVIIGMVEQPEWAQEPADQSQRRHSSGANLILVLRDFTGKYAWKTSLRYLEEKSPTSNSLCPPSVQDSSTPTSSASSEGSSLQVSQPSVQLSVTSPTDDPTLSMSEVGSLSNSRSFAQNVATSPPESATPSGRLRTLRPSSAPSHLRSSELQADKLRRKALLTHHNLLHAHPQPDQQSSIQETQGGGHTRSASQELLHPPLETPRRPASAMSTSSHNSIHAAPLGPKMDRRSYKPFSVRPRSAPQLPPNSSILTVKAHNESEGAIPTLETLASGSPSFEKIKTVTKRHAVLEEASWNRAERSFRRYPSTE
ncbi:hypothetical protein DFJ73DRAFT_428613 [Zopfochytrium polystomum]|nr:hypothetical protein DFJ73DRAFT_428613 [Zopfochytrium polystomum]